MPRTRIPYSEEFRQQIVELVRSGRSPGELAKEFEPSDQTIRNWVVQADRDGGRRTDGATSEEIEELKRLRRENKRPIRSVEPAIIPVPTSCHMLGHSLSEFLNQSRNNNSDLAAGFQESRDAIDIEIVSSEVVVGIQTDDCIEESICVRKGVRFRMDWEYLVLRTGFRSDPSSRSRRATGLLPISVGRIPWLEISN